MKLEEVGVEEEEEEICVCCVDFWMTELKSLFVCAKASAKRLRTSVLTWVSPVSGTDFRKSRSLLSKIWKEEEGVVVVLFSNLNKTSKNFLSWLFFCLFLSCDTKNFVISAVPRFLVTSSSMDELELERNPESDRL